MAAWMVLMMMIGWLGMGVAVGVIVGPRLRDAREVASTSPLADEVMRRLVEVALPAREEAGEKGKEEGDEELGSDGEYEPPPPEIPDWTDTFINHERPLVGRLAPGQGIPGLGDSEVDPVNVWREQGEGTFDQWAAETMVPDAEPSVAWVEPVDLGEFGEVR